MNGDHVEFRSVLPAGGQRLNYTFTGLKWMGDHSIQIGGNVDWMHYKVNKSLNGNPQYNFKIDAANGLTLDQPYEALFGFGNPILSTANNEYGIYAQDSWNVNPHFATTLGVRWDYESHMLDESYVTPANVVAGLTGHVDPRYFSNGNSRKPYKDEIQHPAYPVVERIWLAHRLQRDTLARHRRIGASE